MRDDENTPAPTTKWAYKVMLESKPLPLLGWRRAWAQFRLNVHCGIKFHRSVVVKDGLKFYCGCGDCGFYPEPVENL
jgi:hypothetical protein